MAQKKSTKQESERTSKRKAASPADKKKKAAADKKSQQQLPLDETPHLLDAQTRRDIWGVICAVVAVALFIITAMPEDAVVTSWLSGMLHVVLGLGAYLLPFVLLLIGASLFVKSDGQRVPLRVALGLGLLFFAILVMLALYTPGITPNSLSSLFSHDNLVARGGYIGAGVAWACWTLFGQVVSTILMVGVIIIALVIIGFSISKFIDKVRTLRSKDSELEDGFENMPEAAVRRQSDPQNEERPARIKRVRSNDVQSDDRKLSAAKTALMGSKHKPTRATESIATRVMEDMDQPFEAPKADSAAMTRKLGDKSRKTSKSSSKKPSQNKGDNSLDTLSLLPSMSILKTGGAKRASKAAEAELEDTAILLQETLRDFGVDAEVVKWSAGPTLTLFEVDLPSGVRVSKITNLSDDIALALATPGVRIFAPVPGTNHVGIEMPNRKREGVLLGDVLPQVHGAPLEVAIGKDVVGNDVLADLATLPHLLIGGTTGSGKSVAVHSIIMSILMRCTPEEVRFIMIDPKRVEFTFYNGIPHLYVPVVTEAREAASALAWGVAEMERRLKVFSKAGVRDIGSYNSRVESGAIQADEGEEEIKKMPYIVIVIDELADLMMNVGKEVEFSISRIAQLARAAGIHLIIATQRPSANVVTGLIKANITSRIALKVGSGIDSRVILDQTGAEKLIGKGDMLLMLTGYTRPRRVQSCYVSDQEIAQVVDFLKSQGEPEYHDEILKTNLITIGDSKPDGNGGGSGDDDPLIWEAADIVVNSGMGSTSNIQRRLKVGYSRAGRIMDMLEEKGIVGPPNGSKPREVLVDAMELETLKAFEQNDE